MLIIKIPIAGDYFGRESLFGHDREAPGRDHIAEGCNKIRVKNSTPVPADLGGVYSVTGHCHGV